MPQLEDGYLKIANEIIDAFCHIRISGVEWQLLWVVLRQTYGWNKKKENISLKWFVKMTGLRKPNVVRELKKLREKNLIIVIKNDNDKGNIYKFNKNLDEWKPLSKKITLSKMITTVIKNDNLPLSKMRPIKDTLIKDTFKKQKRKDISVQPELEQGQKRSEKRAVKVKNEKPKIPFKEIVNLYNEILPELPRVLKLTPAREKALSARWKEYKDSQNISYWKHFFLNIRNIPFLMGDNNRNWKPDFEWMINPNNFIKIIEGKYLRSKPIIQQKESEKTLEERRREYLNKPCKTELKPEQR